VPKAICAAPLCKALTLHRGRRPHHAQKERVCSSHRLDVAGVAESKGVDVTTGPTILEPEIMAIEARRVATLP